MMKIAIIGTRGIPNCYGGFEQFVSYIAPMLAAKGNIVWVYNPSWHKYKEKQWKGVELIKKYDARKITVAGQLIYDLLCILDTRKRKPDIIFQLGYTSSSIWSFLFPGPSWIITNMDGLEWKRSKYSGFAKMFLRQAEKLAVKYSNVLIADSIAIRQYIDKKYHKQAYYIPYGAIIFEDPDQAIVINYGLTSFGYDLVIARCVPENHIETILQGFLHARTGRKLVVIGMDDSRYARHLLKNYSNPEIIFKRSVYDMRLLNNLRYYSNLYFHGHSVGGTNPSLLEAMACCCLIIAHNNIFNKEVLGKHAYYFKNAADISLLLAKPLNKQQHIPFMEMNLQKIQQQYNWENIYTMIGQLVSDREPATDTAYQLQDRPCV